MLTGQRIVCLSSIDWDFSWQGHQQIVTALARQGNRVLFVENTGIRTVTWDDLPRLRRRVRNWRRSAAGLRCETEGLWIYSPMALPFPYSPLARRINRAIITRVVRAWLDAAAGQPPILWTFLPTPLVHDLIRQLGPVLTVYYCIDDLPASSPGAAPAAASEAALFRDADVVLVTAERLRARALRHRAVAHVFPFGVAYDLFERARRADGPPPADLGPLARPIAGYVGGVNQKLDQALLAGVARRLPATSFAMIGPVESRPAELPRCPNVRLLGSRPHAELPRYLREFAVGLVPYRLTAYTAHVYPTKLNEYLAMGIPVVSTPLPEVVRFNAQHGDVVALAAEPEAFARAIARAAQDTSREAVQRRLEAARRNDWAVRLPAMFAVVEEALARRAGPGPRAGTPDGAGAARRAVAPDPA
jgi:glycosyltransferase involved in cell wall biosynthesis